MYGSKTIMAAAVVFGAQALAFDMPVSWSSCFQASNVTSEAALCVDPTASAVNSCIAASGNATSAAAYQSWVGGYCAVSSSSSSATVTSSASPSTPTTTQMTTSTVYTTTLITVTSCAATVTNCPAHSTVVITSTVPAYTTVCPVTATSSASSSPVSPYINSKPTPASLTSTVPVPYTTSVTTWAPVAYTSSVTTWAPVTYTWTSSSATTVVTSSVPVTTILTSTKMSTYTSAVLTSASTWSGAWNGVQPTGSSSMNNGTNTWAAPAATSTGPVAYTGGASGLVAGGALAVIGAFAALVL
ncbi:hypothetical protein LTR62_000925 [Meristemomyces frigidus]|uniref:Uncharacterized protein n=1 Tax=Meristemomyces frigidus TaxID=1508187 RepID=A0AAN7YBW3_9PEZI|nr:hypothetical protein LTR62_000925 [Meristemomyces frigidus]